MDNGKEKGKLLFRVFGIWFRVLGLGFTILSEGLGWNNGKEKGSYYLGFLAYGLGFWAWASQSFQRV